MSWLEASVRWYGVLVCCTWALAPFVRWLGLKLADRGVTILRPVGLLAAVYPAWLLAALGVAVFTPAVAIATVISAGALGWAMTWRHGQQVFPWVRSLLLAEAASLALFVVFVWLRGYSPEILGTEKPMDIAFLASSSRTLTIPPPDPWFAGEPINYYYLGYLLHGTIGRVAGVAPETGFNLALATTFSMTAVAAFGVGWNAVRPWLGSKTAVVCGSLAAIGVTAAGNLYAPARLLQDINATVSAWWWDSTTGIGWRSSRIVCDGPRSDNLCQFPSTETINEFPAFSFLLGDLHPHLMALPFTLVAIALAWNLARRGWTEGDPASWQWVVRLLVSGAVVGALLALNTWDFPTYLAIVALGVLAGHGGSLPASWKSIVVLAATSTIAWLPFLAAYDPPAIGESALPAWIAGIPVVSSLIGTVAPHVGERTSAGEYLTMFGAPYAVGLALVIWGVIAQTREAASPITRMVLVTWAGLIVTAALLSAPVLVLCGMPLALVIARLRRAAGVGPLDFSLAGYAVAWLLSMAVEIVYIRDAFNDRMNTLFKFYYQTWTLYAVAAAVALVFLWSRRSRFTWHRPLIAVAGTCMVIAGLAYPVVASYQWTEGFSGWEGLDGLAYGEATTPDDVAAVRWLAEHSSPGDVVLEAAGCSYRPFGRLPYNRVSAFTGIPTIIGWGDNHQRQWRAGQPERISAIAGRQEDVSRMFADPQSPLFEHYGVDWLYVGAFEAGDWQAACPTAGPYPAVSLPDYPGSGWTEAFRSGDTRVYRRVAP